MIKTKQLFSCPAFVPVYSGALMCISVGGISKTLKPLKNSQKRRLRNEKAIGSTPISSTTLFPRNQDDL